MRRVEVIFVALILMVLVGSIPCSACDSGYLLEFYNTLEEFRNQYATALGSALEHLADTDRHNAAVDLDEALLLQDDINSIINQAALDGCITSKVQKQLISAFKPGFKDLQAAYDIINNPGKTQDVINKALLKAGKDDLKVDKAIGKAASGNSVITLAEVPATAGFHNPGETINYVINGLPADCCASQCVRIDFESTAYDLEYTPVIPTVIGDPSCTGHFSVVMGEDQGGAGILVQVGSVTRKRLLYNYGEKTTYTKADYAGHYVGTASGCVTVYLPDGPMTFCASAEVYFDIDAYGAGYLTAGSSDLGFGATTFKLSPKGSTKFASGSISVAGARVSWSGSFMIGRGGISADGGWSVSIPGADGSGTWSLRRVD